MNLSQLEAACIAIRRNPVTHLGLADKELFHSNFLAWLAETHPRAATAVFCAYLAPDANRSEVSVEREWRHVDLVMRLGPFRPLVIENKTFSPPDREQLDRYGVNAAVIKLQAQFVLLSLSRPGWADATGTATHGAWKWMSYDELALGLDKAQTEIDDSFDRELVRRYADLVRRLAAVATAYGALDDADPVIPSHAEIRLLNDARLGDGILKLRSRMIRARIAPDAAGELGNYFAGAEAGFTNGTPLLGVAANAGELRLGWQFQHGQFRLFVSFVRNDLHGPSMRDERALRAASLSAATMWFDFTAVEALLGERAYRPKRARPDRHGFNHYNPNFVYTYRAVRELTVGELLHLNRTYAQQLRVASERLRDT